MSSLNFLHCCLALIKDRSLLRLGAVVMLCSGQSALAAGGLIQMNNWYYRLGKAIFGTPEAAAYWWPVLGAAFVVVLIVVLGMLSGLHRLEPEKLSDEELLPPPKFGLKGFFEVLWSIVSSTLGSVIGKSWENYATLLGGTFFFIVLCNLSGLVPGFAPATEQMNTTLAMALVIFVAFNYIGLKHGGVDYIKHLAGPILLLAPLMIPIEVISLLARPVSLSLRLFGNISGDHLVFNVFSTLMRDANIPFMPVPAGILVFGTLVAILQAFIFMTLSAVYVRLSLDTAHHH
jgi:F-type H+-transporting ATPase subunit a